MSTTIDQKVVEMRFDNRQFESNVSTTMSTLDKLKQKLNLTGAAKGFEDIGRAANKVDMSGLGRGVEQVGVKFNAMYTIADQALRNITTRVQQTAENMVKALTIDPIKTGFSEYETQINATQTILANTASKGSTIDDVNKALSELNTYADKTIYNFTEMTRNIGTFTAAGIDLDTSVNAIQGIANLAAVSGSTSQQASTAMYQLSQALAAGTIRLMDWNSVVNAGMGGEMFQNALKETSRLLGTGADEAIRLRGSFRESLRDEWLTAEVLTETLKKFTTTGANEYIAEYTGLTKEAVDAETARIDTATDTKKAIDEVAESLAKASGKSKDEIKAALEFARNAEDAATKVKTFTQLWDVLKESAQSGWSQTWKLLVGDFEQAKALLTPLADLLTGFINKMSDARNKVIESALGKSFKSLFENVKNGLKPVQETAEGIKEVVKSVEDYANVVNEIIGGKWGTGQARWDKLTEAGYDWAHAQNLVNEKLGSSVRHATNYKEAQNGVTKAQEEATEATTAYIMKLTMMSEEEAKALGYSDKQIKAFKELAAASEKTGIPLKEFIENIDQIDGRYLMINGFKNAGDALLDTFKAIGNAWKSMFPPKSIEEKAQGLFNLLAAFHKFTREMSNAIYVNGNFTATGMNLIRTLKGIFAIVDLVTTLVGGGFKIAFKVVTSILDYFDLDILSVTAKIGDMLVKFDKWVNSLFDVSSILDKVIPALSSGVKVVKEWVAALKKTEGVQKFLNVLDSEAVQSLVEACKRLARGFNELGGSGISKVGKAIGAVFVTIANAVKKMTGIDIGGIFSKIADAFTKLTGIDLRAEGEFTLTGLIKGLAGGAADVIEFIAQFAADLINKFCDILGIASPSKVFIALGGFIIAGLIAGITDGFTSVPGTLQELVAKTIGVIKEIDWGAVFAIGAAVSALMFLHKIGNALENFSAPFAAFGDIAESITKVTGAMATKLKAQALKELAITLAILVACVLAIVKIGGEDPKLIWNAVGVVLALGAVLAALGFAANQMSKANVTLEKGKFSFEGVKSSLLSIAAAIGILALTVKLIGGMDVGEAIGGFIGLAALMGAIIGFIYIVQKVTTGDISENIDKVGGMMLKLSIAMLLMVAVCKLVGKLSAEEMVKGGIFVFAMALFVRSLTSVTSDTGEHISKVGGMMLKLSIALILMVAVCKLVGKLSVAEMVKGGIFIAAMGAFVRSLVAVAKSSGNNVSAAGGMLVKMALAMVLMVGICKLAAKLSVAEMIKGGLFAAAMLIFTKYLVETTTIGKKQQIAQVAGTLLALSVSIGIMALVCAMLSLLKVESLVKGVAAVSVLGLVMATMVKSLNGAHDVMKSLIVMTAAIAVMAIAVAALSIIPFEKLGPAVGSMALLMGMFAVMLKSLNGMYLGKETIGALILLTAIVGALAFIVWKLAKDIKDPKAAVTNVIALSGLMLAMGGVMKILSTMKTNATTALKSIGVLTTMVVPMFLFIELIKSMNGMESAEKNVLLLVGTMYAMTVLLAVLSLVGKLGLTSALTGIIGLTAMVVPMMAFVMILDSLRSFNLSEVRGNIEILVGVMVAMTALLAVLTIIGIGGIFALAGIIALTAMVGPMLTFTWMMKKLTGVDLAVGNIMLLIHMMTVMTMLVGHLADAGPMAIVGVTALQGLIILMGELAIFATAIGALFTWFPDLEKFLNKGIPVLEKLAGALGTMIGKFIGSIGEAIGDSLVEIGKDIAEFMVWMKHASIIAGSIKASSIDGFSEFMKKLSKCLLGVGGTSVVTSIADVWTGALNGGKDSMTKFAEDGVAFFDAMREISYAAEDFTFPKNFNPDDLTKMIEAIGSVAKISIGSSIADIWVNILGGKGDQDSMSKFTEDGKAFFKAMKEIAKEMEGADLPDDYNIEGLERLLGVLNTVSKSMIGTSFADMFTSWFSNGQNGMEKFAEDGKAFFAAVKEISKEMENAEFPDDFNIEGLETLLEALKTVGTTMTGVSLSDIFAKMVGDEGAMEKFQSDGTAFFHAIAAISAEMENVKLSDNLPSKESLTALFELLKSVGEYTSDQGWSDLFTRGGTTIEKFKADAVGLFTALSTVSTEAAKIQLGNFDTVRSALSRTKQIFAETAAIEYDSAAIADFTGIGFGQGGFGADGPLNRIAKALHTFNTDAACIQLGYFDTVRSAIARAKVMVAELIGIDYSGVKSFTGVGDGWFGADGPINDIAKSMSTFSTKAANVDLAIFDTVGNAVRKAIDVVNILPTGEDAYAGVQTFTGIGDGWWGADGPVNDIAVAIKTFSETVTGVDMSTFGTVQSAVNTAKEIITGLAGLDYTGVKEFTGVGEGGIGADGPLKKIGMAIAEFGTQIDGTDVTNVDAAVSVAGRLKTLIHGLVGLDSSGVENFKVKEIGTALKDYNTDVSGINPEQMQSSLSVARDLKSFIIGLSGMDNSGVALFSPTSIGAKLQGYSAYVTGINYGDVTASIVKAGQLRDFINSLAGMTISGVSSFVSAVETLGTVQVENIITAFNTAADTLYTTGAQIIDKLADGMKSKQAALTSATSTLTKAIKKEMRAPIDGTSDTIKSIGTQYVSKMAKGITENNTAAATAITTLVSNALTAANEKYQSFYSAGSYLADGFAAGISTNAYKAAAKARAMAQAAKKAAEEALGIASPSKVFYKIGDYTGQGFVKALGDYNSKSYAATSEMADYAKDGLTNALGGIQKLVDGELDTQPTIRPVVDLSDVRTGAAAIGGLFGNGVSVGAMANVNAINRTMSGRVQNGNDDVVSAINKLGASLANASGDTYNFGDFSYDDGSAVSDAVKTLVKAARVERRR